MSKKILVVDDNDDLLTITEVILKGQGYEVLLARTIDEAVSSIQSNRPALVLLDVFICDGDGRELCSRIKNETETAHVRVILMSGDDDNLGMMAWVGADDFLSKPFDVTELTTKVKKQLVTAQALSRSA